MELDFIKPQSEEAKAKATVHRSSGKIGFSRTAEMLMNIGDWKFCRIARDKNDESNECLYLVKADEYTDDALKVYRAGDYFYIKGAGILKEVGIDYSDSLNTYIFDISSMNIEGYESIFKMKKRVVKRNKKANG